MSVLAIIGNVVGSVVGDPGLGSQVELAVQSAGGLVGGGGSSVDSARQTRVNVYLIGALAGIVDSARLMLGLSQEPAPHNLLAWNETAMQRVKMARSDVWTQAVAAGPLHDRGNDAHDGMALLLAQGIGVNLPYLGTDDGHAGGSQSYDSPTLAAKLIALARGGSASPTGDIPAGSTVTAGKGLTPAGSTIFGLPPLALVALAGGALYLMTRKGRG